MTGGVFQAGRSGEPLVADNARKAELYLELGDEFWRQTARANVAVVLIGPRDILPRIRPCA